MRLGLRVLCAVALAGCSASPTPVESRSRVHPTDRTFDTPGGRPDRRATFDPRLISERVDALFTARLATVGIPVDGVSRASDAVHPDIACPPDSWNGSRCWLMYTPYKNSDPAVENPGFLRAASDTTWVTPSEVTNPIVAYPGTVGYNSDPDHAYDPTTHRLVQVYRVVSGAYNNIMIMSTADAKHWTTPRVAFKELNHDAVSPALIIEPNRVAKIWYVKAGAAGCSATASDIELRTAMPDAQDRYEHGNWSRPTVVNLVIPGYVPWHLDVIAVGGDFHYLALIAAYPRATNCATSDLWLASSLDGVNWHTYAMPVLWRAMLTAKNRKLSTWYRGTLRYSAETDSLDLWPSALSKTTWTVYHAAVKLSDLLGLLDAVKPGDFKPSFNEVANALPGRMP